MENSRERRTGDFGDLFEDKLAITDGGLGTTLEEIFHLNISQTALWSAKPIIEQSEVVIQAHLAFLRAGADIISTSTYQCSFSTFKRAGYSETDAKAIMLKSVQLAQDARELYSAETGNTSGRIALSLGPFGASLTPAQEFDGFYPPPYGPKEYSAGADNVNAFDFKSDEGDKEQKSIEALAHFHYERLLIFLDDAKAWETIDCIAFETVPLTREITSIRLAMGQLAAEISRRGDVNKDIKPWWISAVFPNGRFPEKHREDSSSRNIKDVVHSALGRQHNSDGPSLNLPVPSAFGINCTAIEHLPALLKEISEATTSQSTSSDANKPWLVVYPNGGETYDPISQTWLPNNVEENRDAPWAQRLGHIVSDLYKNAAFAIWGGVIVGGCCRIGPKEIGMLRNLLKVSTRSKEGDEQKRASEIQS